MKEEEFDMKKIVSIGSMDFSKPETQKELLNIIEALGSMVISLKQENQQLKDEINRLKGEQGKPNIKPNTKDKPNDENSNTSKKMDAGKKKIWNKSSKKDRVKIDKTLVVELDTTNLPSDIEFKGYREIIIQDLEIRTNNVLYKLQQYYSPSEHKTYTAEIDPALKNTEFGSDLKALCSTLYFENRVTENKIASFLNSNGVIISEGTVSNILIKDKAEELSAEKKEIYTVGLNSSRYQQTDDTGMRVAGKNAYATIVCNEYYSAYFINDKKNRETAKKILYNNYDLEDNKADSAVFTVLIADDASQFHDITEVRGLCWIHEERHFVKLVPFLECHTQEVERMRGELWDYYNKLKEYKLNPTDFKKGELSIEFDKIFSQATYYDKLTDRLKLTFAKKEYLLAVLEYPEIPLHNNLSENGVRELVVKRKISGGVKTVEGKTAWENNMTILATCKKLGVSFYKYMKGIFSGEYTDTRLAEIIASK
jgi:hypothetical protein